VARALREWPEAVSQRVSQSIFPGPARRKRKIPPLSALPGVVNFREPAFAGDWEWGRW